MAQKIYQVLNTGLNNTIAMSNTMHLAGATYQVLTVAELNAGIGAIRTFYDTLKVYNCSTQVWTPGSRVLELDLDVPTTPPRIMGTTPGATVTGTGGVQTINQAAVCVAWRTVLAGRSYRGRTFLGVLAASTVAGGVMSGGVVSTVNTAANALVTALAALGTPLNLKVYSRKLSNATSIISGVTDAIPDVLRSRKK